MTEIEHLRDRAARYRRMMKSVDDKRANEALQLLARECEVKIAKMEQKPPARLGELAT
jgi:hypothetical protein